MGVAMTYAAIQDKEFEQILNTLSLRTTGKREEIPEASISTAKLKHGWTLVLANEFESKLFGPDRLKTISAGTQVVLCMVEEHVMFSYATGWRDGKQIWSLEHRGDSGDVNNLKKVGALPTELEDIEAGLRKQQLESTSNVDFIFDAPVSLFFAMTGFRYDQDLPDSDEPFEILEKIPAQEQPSHTKPWWKIW